MKSKARSRAKGKKRPAARRGRLWYWGVFGTALALLGLWALSRKAEQVAPALDIDLMLEQMTLAQKAGQLVMTGFPGNEPGTEAETLVRDYCVGGVVLTARQTPDTAQTARTTGRLQELAAASASCAGVPLFIAADQEGGYVVRLRGPHLFPGNMALGAIGSAGRAREVARAIGLELKAAGINMNLAPVLDVNSNPQNPVIGVRSFGEDAAAVAELGAAYIAGLHDAGVLAVAKHFPGHGDTAVDSHISLPSVPHARERLDRVELVPFRRAIDTGVDAVMTSHVTFPAIEPIPGLPATLSAKVLTGLLREELGFAGLIITDALEMKAIVDNFGLAEAAVKAVEAGADIVLVGWPTDWRQACRAVEAIMAAVKEGKVSEERLNASVRRILRAKLAAGLWKEASATTAAESAALAETVAGEAVTLVRDRDRRLPLNPQDTSSVLVIMPQLSSITRVEETDPASAGLAAYLRRYLPRAEVTGAFMSLRPGKEERERLVKLAQEHEVVVVATYYAWSASYIGQAELVLELMRAGREPVVTALREPYDLLRFPEVGTYIATYSANPESLEALAAVLTGRREATGRLPVSLPGLYSAGYRYEGAR